MAISRIPNEYIEEHNVKNLFRVGLPSFWRMLYSTGTSELNQREIILIVDILDHDSYNKKFGYRGR